MILTKCKEVSHSVLSAAVVVVVVVIEVVVVVEVVEDWFMNVKRDLSTLLLHLDNCLGKLWVRGQVQTV